MSVATINMEMIKTETLVDSLKLEMVRILLAAKCLLSSFEAAVPE